MRSFRIVLAVLLFSTLALAEGEQQFANLRSCKLESGETILDCRIGYRTWGKLNAEKSNVVVMLTWFTGNSGMLAGSLGPDKFVDPAKYFVVGIDALADGVSSSPSNSPLQSRAKFPHITIADMVETQHRVLTETLKFTHVHAIFGGSMGGMQGFQWAVQYPDFMDVVATYVGSTQLTPHDLLLWRAEGNAILDSKEWQDGNYRTPLIIPAVADIHNLELTTPDNLNQKMSRENFGDQAEKMEEDESFDPANRLRQLEAMMSHDVSKRFGGRMAEAARAVKAHMLIIVDTQDHMVNPAPALAFAKLLNVQPVILDSNCGHLGPGCDPKASIPAVRQALAAH